MAGELPPGFTLDTNRDPSIPEGFQLDDDQANVEKYLQLQDSHGGLGQQVKAGLEGAASAATFGLSTGLERALGVDPEDIRKRREANPVAHGAGQLAGLVGTALIPGMGEANALKVMSGGGNLAAKAVGLGAAETLAGRMAAGAVKAGAENAMFQTGDEISKMLTSDPSQSVQTALTNVGLSGLLGAGVGGMIGGVPSLWKLGSASKVGEAIDQMKQAAVDPSLAGAGVNVEKKGIVEGLKELKKNAPEIRNSAKIIGDAPVFEGQLSASKPMQEAESLLSHSRSPLGVARQQEVQRGMGMANDAIESTLSTGDNLTQVDVGKALKEELVSTFEAQYEPLKAMYALRKQSTEHIPLSPVAKRVISANIKKLENYKFTGSGARNVGDFILKNMDSLQTVDDLQRISTEINNQFRMTAPHAVGEVVEKLKNLEEATIIRSAKQMAKENPAMAPEVLRLIDENKVLKASYREFREEMGEFGAVLGKKRIRGPGDFLEFVDGMNPEDMAKKLFRKDNSTFAAKLAQKYPGMFQKLAGLERQKLVPQINKDGSRNWHGVAKQIFDDKKMPPEIRELIFSPGELEKIKAAKVYVEEMPANMNPSGTAFTEEALKFYSSPYHAAKVTARDAVVKKMLSNLVNKGEEQAFYNSVFPAMAEAVKRGETNPSALKSAVNYGLSVVKGERMIYQSTRALFKGTREVLPSSAIETSEKQRENLDKKVAEFQDDPEKFMSMGGETSVYMPQHAVAMGETAARVINFLAQAKPKDQKLAPLDDPIKPSKAEMQEYNGLLNIADKPLSILSRINSHTLLPSDVMALNAMYPDLYNKLKLSMTKELIEVTSKGEAIPYKLKQSLSMFMGEPLDSTLTPAGIMGAQASFALQKAPSPNVPAPQGGGDKSKLSKSTANFRTAEQSREDRRNDS